MNGRTYDQEQAMIPTHSFTNENETMEEAMSSQDERIANSENKPSYPKRSNVVGLWKKREGAIKASRLEGEEEEVDDGEAQRVDDDGHLGDERRGELDHL